MDDDLKNNVFAGDEKIDAIAQKINEAGKESFLKNASQAQFSPSTVESGTGTSQETSEARKELEKEFEVSPKEKPINPLRTYGDDIASTIKNQKESVLSINLAEKKKLEVKQGLTNEQSSEINTGETSRKNFIITIISIALVIAGLGTLVTLYIIKKINNNPEETEIAIVADNHAIINLGSLEKNQIIGEISKKRGESMKADSIIYLDLSQGAQTLETSNFLPAISPRIPDYLLRAFDKKLVLGFYSQNTNDLFQIININSYDNAFAGMLEWEKSMPNELLPLFSTIQDTIDEPLKNKEFQDRIISNKDVRVLKDNDRNPILLYSFLDAKTLLISSSEASFRELIKRYNTSKLER